LIVQMPVNRVNPDIVIRSETPEDHGVIRAVTVDAFTNSAEGYHGEADLVDTLRASSECLSLVACCGDRVIGHILFTPVWIRTQQRELQGMGLAPLSVASGWQRRGVGSLLVRSGLERLTEDHCPFVVVLGHPGYYSRFGFVPASRYGVFHGFAGIPQDVFFIRPGDSGTLDAVTGGLACYRSEFGPQDSHKNAN
jgi:predicted N-acetyltransferase YhbS